MGDKAYAFTGLYALCGLRANGLTAALMQHERRLFFYKKGLQNNAAVVR